MMVVRPDQIEAGPDGSGHSFDSKSNWSGAMLGVTLTSSSDVSMLPYFSGIKLVGLLDALPGFVGSPTGISGSEVGSRLIIRTL